MPSLLLLALLLVAAGADSPTAVEEPRTIHVVLDNAYAPYVFRSEKGVLQGIVIDQWLAWAEKTGIAVEFHPMDWSEALRRMRAGEFDVIDSIVETPERREYFDFTPGYASIEASIFFRNKILGITDLASLKGFPVAAKAGDQHIDKLRANGVTTVIPFGNNEQIIEAVSQGKVNVFVVDAPSALYLLNRAGLENEFRHSAPVFRDELRRAVRKGDTEMLRTVSAGFAAIEPERIRRIEEKWFGRTINRYGRYLTWAAYAAGVAFLLIAGLAVWNGTLHRRILQRTAALGESEQRFRQITENMHEVFWLSDSEQVMLYVSPAYEAVWGRSRESLYREPRAFFTAIDPEDRTRVEKIMKGNGERSFEAEYRVVRPDGSIRWIRARGFPVRDESGRFYRIAGIAEDMTERKRAEEKLKATTEQLRALSARLQSAREEESSRISREIHDELGSALTSLRWDLEGIRKHVSDSGKEPQAPALRTRITDMLQLTDATINVVRRIASDLRPEVLEVLGLVEAVKWQARQFQDRTGILVHCDIPMERVDFNHQQSTAIFRIFQEAMTNVARHAHATRVAVTTFEERDAFILIIRDNGRGIAETEKSGQMSIGLLGMEERAHLIGGEVEISGVPGAGTTVTVRIPMEYRSGVMRAPGSA